MMVRTLSGRIFVAALLATTFLSPWTSTFAQAAQKKGDASLRVEYQYIRTGEYESTIGPFDVGNTDGHTLLLSGDYALNDRWRISASLPYIQRRHTGALPHNAVIDFQNYTPPNLKIIDDGSYHGGFQDLFLGVSYLALDGPLTITPHLSFGLPTWNYPFYAHSAIGRNIWHLPVGASLSFTPYFSDWLFKTDISYVFSEKSLGINVNHWLIYASASYFMTPRFAPKIYVSYKNVPKGVSFPDDFPPESFDSAFWYFHDRTIRHSYTNAGIGFDWILNEKYQLTGTVFTMVKPDEVNVIDYAFTLGLTRFFSRD